MMFTMSQICMFLATAIGFIGGVFQDVYAGSTDIEKPEQRGREVGAPPNDVARFRIDGNNYVSGIIYLKSCEDTLALKEVGFRGFRGIVEEDSIVCMDAFWPTEMDWSHLPDELLGQFYLPAEENDWEELFDQKPPIEMQSDE